jgi:hypothetical protein
MRVLPANSVAAVATAKVLNQRRCFIAENHTVRLSSDSHGVCRMFSLLYTGTEYLRLIPRRSWLAGAKLLGARVHEAFDAYPRFAAMRARDINPPPRAADSRTAPSQSSNQKLVTSRDSFALAPRCHPTSGEFRNSVGACPTQTKLICGGTRNLGYVRRRCRTAARATTADRRRKTPAHRSLPSRSAARRSRPPAGAASRPTSPPRDSSGRGAAPARRS